MKSNQSVSARIPRSLPYLFVTLLIASSIGCGDKDPDKGTDNTTKTTVQKSEKAPTCESTPKPERCTKTTPAATDFGRATLLSKMEIAPPTEQINVAGETIRNGLGLIASGAKSGNQGSGASIDMNKMIADAIAAGKLNIVIEAPDWQLDQNAPGADNQSFYFWLGEKPAGDEIKINKLSVDKGSYPKGVFQNISIAPANSSPGAPLKITTTKPQSTHMNTAFAGMTLPIDIEGAKLTGTVEAVPGGGFTLTNAVLLGAIDFNSFKKGILEIVKKCTDKCYSVDETNLSCQTLPDESACTTALSSKPKELQIACPKIKGFCSQNAQNAINVAADSLGDKRVLGAKFILEGKSIKISGIATP